MSIGAAEFVPAGADLTELRAAACGCRGCGLYRDATRTVFGAGPPDARIVMVGEQPGDQEDRRGHPFVGPAGRLLDRALSEAGVERDEVYLTNAVKHFKFEQRGKRRIHQRPSGSEITACSAWLTAELSAVRPTVVVCLGAVAAKAILGNDFKVTQHRGEIIASTPYRVLATVHPSAILRSPDRTRAYDIIVSDLRTICSAV
jgi:uracil-DNA glycosylase